MVSCSCSLLSVINVHHSYSVIVNWLLENQINLLRKLQYHGWTFLKEEKVFQKDRIRDFKRKGDHSV